MPYEESRGRSRRALRAGAWGAIIVLAAAMAFFAVDRGRLLLWTLRAKRTVIGYSLHGERVTGVMLVDPGRAERRQTLTVWYDDTGMLAADLLVLSGEPGRCTVWRPDGAIRTQFRPGPSWILQPGLERVPDRWETPPWRWGEEPQTRPSAPWLRAGITAAEWFDREVGR